MVRDEQTAVSSRHLDILQGSGTTSGASWPTRPRERIALHDNCFIEKKFYPNIDFYSGITLEAMGFPTTMFTVLFALAGTVGWIGQWKEMIQDPNQKIGRPRQLCTSATRRDHVPMSRRK